MAYTTIDNPELFFQTKIYTGTGSSRSITLDGSENMQPDWIWIKRRATGNANPGLFDSVRGATKLISASSGDVEQTLTTELTSFDSNGFSLGDGSNGYVNQNSGKTYVAWNWKAGTSFSNSAGYNGADLASTGSYNRTCGFSIVTFTGNATADQQIYHGLNSVPKWMLLKNRTNSNGESWCVYHVDVGNTKKLTLDTTATPSTNVEFWQDTTPTSTVLTVGRQDAVNGSGNTHVVYCFSEVQGYSKFGTYRGTSDSTDGSYTWLGFKPAWVMMKRTDSADWWGMHDNKRSTFNPNAPHLEADSSGAEGNGPEMDFLSNGFKMRNTNAGMNNSSGTYVYMAFAESPFVNSNGVPNNAE
jgi:hypothetical protein